MSSLDFGVTEGVEFLLEDLLPHEGFGTRGVEQREALLLLKDFSIGESSARRRLLCIVRSDCVLGVTAKDSSSAFFSVDVLLDEGVWELRLFPRIPGLVLEESLSLGVAALSTGGGLLERLEKEDVVRFEVSDLLRCSTDRGSLFGFFRESVAVFFGFSSPPSSRFSVSVLAAPLLFVDVVRDELSPFALRLVAVVVLFFAFSDDTELPPFSDMGSFLQDNSPITTQQRFAFDGNKKLMLSLRGITSTPAERPQETETKCLIL